MFALFVCSAVYESDPPGLARKVTRRNEVEVHSMYSDIHQLIPQHKSDFGRANSAVKAGYPAVEPILPGLLQCLQDYNWPVAHVLGPFLIPIGAPLIPHVRVILDTDDDIWKYWIIGNILRESREVAEAFREDLERLAYSPETSEGLDEATRETLGQYGWQRA